MRYSEAWLETKPYKEVFDGGIHPKVSPQLDHLQVQGKITRLLGAWAERRGAYGPELRVYLSEQVSLVPDVAFISYDRLDAMSPGEQQKPQIAPELVVEVRSPGDRDAKVRRKSELYLEYGALAVLDVDPALRTVRVTTAAGERLLLESDTFEDSAFPGLRLSVAAMFSSLERRRRRSEPPRK